MVGRNEGFRVVAIKPGDVRRLSRHAGEVRVPKAGWVFVCTACGFGGNADVNAARNIAAGHPTHLPIPLHWRGGDGVTRAVNREPHLELQQRQELRYSGQHGHRPRSALARSRLPRRTASLSLTVIARAGTPVGWPA